ncbi:hypothetical protein [Caulobacter sp. FWC2]|uniref:hypothetical protein n=1 Tax=Caulobacter sp. FWC2 TaxID=69664 RepID=UPI000C15F432|nr:hypothetical protein [Caulobacter sp. FWC2]PIB91244.1 hypothetical protein CSW62_06440 [Caulobacter sp. FWC2]
MATTLQRQLDDAEATVERLKLQITQGPCIEAGHAWKFVGGKNAGCNDTCSCSVPVHVCEKCGDSDYGETDEASVIRDRCRLIYEHEEG